MEKPEFNLSSTIRECLKKNKNMTSREVLEHVETMHPSHKINKNSFSVAFYTTRKKMGITAGRKGGKPKLKGSWNRQPIASTSGSIGEITITREMMKAAAELLRVCGDLNAALLAVKDVHSFQV